MTKLAFSTLGTPFYTLEQVIELAVDHGFDGIELRALEGTTDLVSLPVFAADALEVTRRRLDDAGMEMPVLDSGVLVDCGSGPIFEQQLEEARRYAELAAAVGAPFMRVFAGPPPNHRSPRSTYAELGEALAQVAEIARRAGVRLLVETHGTLSRSTDLVEVLALGAGEDVGVLWDVMHTYRNGESVELSYATLGSLVKHVHLRDGQSADPTSHAHVLTGQGVMPIAEAVGLLIRNGFDGFFSFEWEKFWVPELIEPEVAVPHFAAEMRRLLPTLSH